MSYQAPIRDIAFALYAAADLERLQPLVEGLDADVVQAVLEGAGELASGVLAPLRRIGDIEGSRLENGKVVTPEGFAEAYRAFAEGGWNSLSAEPEFGGQGLPKALDLAVYEMVNAANMAFALCPTLTQAAIEALQRHGTERHKRLLLPRLISGEWPGTMHLTEPQAGSDLAAIRTMATPDGHGGYLLNGQKIFITWGDHDMAPNIVHLILARTPDAPPGVRGLSLFVATRQEVREDGALGVANDLRPASLEHKLGIHASPTCVMLYEGARAELVGELNQGLAHMFVMMNAARVMVGVQGVGIAEGAYQHALAYARERRQGRSPWSDDPSALIFDHPDVRRMLATMKAKIAAARAICFSAGVAADLALLAPTEGERRKADLRAQLLTPIAKAWSTDMGVEVASLGVQVHGGMGFIEETGAAQFYRDARIAPIYEGTNGIQAIDLVGRKLGLANGEAVADLIEEMRDIASSVGEGQGVVLSAGIDAVARASKGLAKAGGTAALAGAAAYLKLFGDVLGGVMLCKGALAAAAADDPAWAKDRAALARFYAEQVLAGASALADAALAGDEALKGVQF
ncbi:MAG TPA: acyl-CoA dehydrogenase family protein [Caulobacteraceae bacterium]|nr:acyl-CoA dehydrogenase family protein [Caulobacteraceae bacterium]